ncbi:MAG: hypothetical protein U0412_12370 [Nitrospira sp.]
MSYKARTLLITCILMSLFGMPGFALAGGGEAASILNSMPPDLFAKVQALAQQLQQGIKEGKLSEAEVQQGLMSGHLGEKLKTLNPQAGALLDDISDAMKNGKGPGTESLLPLLGGLGIGAN